MHRQQGVFFRGGGERRIWLKNGGLIERRAVDLRCERTKKPERVQEGESRGVLTRIASLGLKRRDLFSKYQPMRGILEKILSRVLTYGRRLTT